MTEEISPKPSQIQSHINLDDLDSMSDFSDEELSSIASKVLITPKINKNDSQNEPMETQSQATQNHFGLSVRIQDKKIKLSSKPKESQVAPSSSSSPVREINKINPGNVMPDDHEALNRLYYMYLYPYRLFFKWLNYGTEASNNFTHREFSFTIQGDIYMRYQTFDSDHAFEDRLKRVCPDKIDIGAVYNIKPTKMSSKSEHLTPESRELVFDVDLTDYDDIRTCCNKTTICSKCWGFMRIAMKIIHRALTEDFGFRHVMWVFSGGRGIHAWVCDERARSLSNEGRRAIANYLTITRPGGPRRVVLPQILHPSISDVMDLVEEAFTTTVLDQQDILNSDKNVAILDNLPEDIRNELQEKWENTSNYVSSQTRWEQLEYSVAKRQKQAKGKEATLLATLVRDLKLHCCFPRLDVHVSTSMNHLLKAPFCIHPRSRKICVPISLDQFDSFDPEFVPTDYTLISELNKDSSPGGSYTAKKTSVWPYIQTFQSFVDGLLADQPKKHIGSLDF